MSSIKKVKSLFGAINYKSIYPKISNSILVGGIQSNHGFLIDDVLELLKARTGKTEVESFAHFYHSLFKPSQGIKGTLYTVGDVVISWYNNKECVGIVESFFCLHIDSEPKKFVLLVSYRDKKLNGERIVDKYSGYRHVLITEQKLVLIPEELLCLAMFYENDDDSYSVIDYMRPQVPLVWVVIPYYPVINDVVKIALSNFECYCEIIAITETTKKCKIKYLVQSSTEGQLKPMSGRGSIDNIEWDNVIQFIKGSSDITHKLFTEDGD